MSGRCGILNQVHLAPECLKGGTKSPIAIRLR